MTEVLHMFLVVDESVPGERWVVYRSLCRNDADDRAEALVSSSPPGSRFSVYHVQRMTAPEQVLH